MIQYFLEIKKEKNMNISKLIIELILIVIQLVFIHHYLKQIYSPASKRLNIFCFGSSWILFSMIKIFLYIHSTLTISSYIILFIVELLGYSLFTYCWKENKKSVYFHLALYCCLYHFFQTFTKFLYFFMLLPGNWNFFKNDMIYGFMQIIPYFCLWWIFFYKRGFTYLPSNNVHLSQWGIPLFVIAYLLHFCSHYFDISVNIYLMSFMSIITLVIVHMMIQLQYQKELLYEQSKYLKMKASIVLHKEQQQYQGNKKLSEQFLQQLDYIKEHYQKDPQTCIHLLDKLQNEIIPSTSVQNENDFLSAFLDYKLHAMKMQGIHAQLFLDSDLQLMNPFHITTILGNLLDNALEAQRYVSKRHISIRINEDDFYYYIHILNRCQSHLNASNNEGWKTTKADKENHGMGLKNVRNCVQLLKGTCSIEASHNIFQVSITIPKGDILC